MKKRLLSLCLIVILILGITAIPDNTFVTNSTTVSAATFGQKQALKKAKSYLRVMAFSKSSLYDQLIYEGFTKSQARYGVKKAYK